MILIKDIYTPKLAEILPSSIINDEQVHAAAVALDAEIEKVSAMMELVLHLPRLDDLPDEVLDHLAWQYHCDFYKPTLPIQAKRDQIRETIFWHRIKGTPAGTERAISTFMKNSKIEENWEYGGEPYFFRIMCGGLKYLTSDEEFLELIYDAKNVRSWLEEIIFDLTVEEPETDYVGHLELDGGTELTDIAFISETAPHKIFCGILELDGGLEITNAEYEF